jgi:RimJ/RimL family protein N-acetyltransferase
VNTPGLRTRRLRLRPLTPYDAPAIAAGVGDRAVAEWLSRVPHPYALEDALRFIAGEVMPGAAVWGIDDGALAGVISLGDELGYWVAPSRWGRGYATEAARGVLRWHFGDGPGGDVASGHFVGNLRSAQVLARLGFRATGQRRLPCPARGQDVDSIAMMLTRADFLATLRAGA